MELTLAGTKINYLIIFLFILALAGVIMGGFGVKAYSRNNNNNNNNGINDTVNNLTVSNDLTVGRDTTMARNLGVSGTLAVTDNSTLTGTLGVTGLTTLTGGLAPLVVVVLDPINTSTLLAVTENEYLLGRSGGIAVTLPAVVRGSRISFVIYTSASAGDYTITTAGDDIFVGYASILQTDNGVSNTNSFFIPTLIQNRTVMTLNNGTTGGLAGGIIELVGRDSTLWEVKAQLYGSGTLATPFS